MSAGPRSVYADAGVDLDHNDALKAALRTAVASTSQDGSLPGFGAFAGGLRLPSNLREPVLLASTDSLGTKLLLALAWDRPELAGGDIVRHCMNDLAVQNVRPVAFLDYVAAAHLERDVVSRLVQGIAEACRAAGVTLIGGESAQLPDTYRSGAYDLAGTVIGVAEQADLANAANIRDGDVCVGLPAAGPHTNGYSLVRRALERGNPTAPLGDTTVIEAALTPHQSYVEELLRAFRVPGVHAAAHITGGGLIDICRACSRMDLLPVYHRGMDDSTALRVDSADRRRDARGDVPRLQHGRRRRHRVPARCLRNAAGRASRRVRGRIGGAARRRGG